MPPFEHGGLARGLDETPTKPGESQRIGRRVSSDDSLWVSSFARHPAETIETLLFPIVTVGTRPDVRSPR
jgi:hypothetical protein